MSEMISNPQRLIMAVDDDADSLRIVQHALEHEGYKVITCLSGGEALKKLEGITPDLVLLDVNMPQISGLDTLKKLRFRKEYVAVIFISGNSGVHDVVTGLDLGADDYIRKPFNIYEVLARVRSQLRMKDIQDALKEANKKLKDLVDIDDLTGLYNMRSLYQRLDHEISRARRTGQLVGVVMMDMDNFKTVNDSHDHLFGSFVLSEVGKIIKQTIRTTDFAARYGGDEFLVVLVDSTEEGAKVFAERLRESILKYVFESGTDRIKLTSSLGLGLAHPKAKIDARALVRAADHSLYAAKESGKNCVKVRLIKD
jgi:two-component system cell cycle response regulator